MTMTFRALIPVPDPTVGVETTVAAHRASLDGATIGIMNNCKPNSAELLTAIADLLCERYAIREVVGPVQTEGILLASEEQLDDMAAKCDIVLHGLGDCSSCSALSTHNGIAFERRGVPAVVVGTIPFEKSVKAMATRHGYPDFQFVKVTHPLSSLNADAIRARAREALPQVLAIRGVDGAAPGTEELASVGAGRA
jgi:hypothetical protein